jgi:hypothetical protein
MVEIVQGRVDATAPRRVKWGYAYYPELVIHTATGDRALAKVSAAGGVRDTIERGGEGTFYLSKHYGMLGVHGVKLPDGTKYYAHFNNFEKLMGALGVIAAILLLMGLMGMEVPWLPIILGGGFGLYTIFARKGRLENERLFHAA